jgi:DNA-directed RNA polymerase specialized sigma24 family protein
LAELESLYRERYPAFLRVARAMVRDDGAAADAVHDAFVQAVRNRHFFRGAKERSRRGCGGWS